MSIFHLVSYVKLKLAEEDDPSELTNSVDRSDQILPPISKVGRLGPGPFSPSTSQYPTQVTMSLPSQCD